jgi:hypothetical protein
LVRRGHARWLVRAPGRQGPLTPEEVAHALKAQRPELRRALDRRRDVIGVPAHVREEILDEAIGLVVMSRKPILNEEHLQGAFWTSVGYRLIEHRSGRHELHVGSRRRMDFEPVARSLPADSEPFDLVAASERIATAADLMAQLDPFEQRVMAIMAAHKLGVKRAAKALGEPVKTVLAASRSAERKLDQVAAIAAAGRMCDYREPALHAYAQGTARAEQERVARTHLAACAGCRASYASLLREMRGREYKRAASAAFLPAPMLAAELHSSWIERLTTFLSTGRTPTGTATAERTAGVLGGGGLVKAAAVGSAIVVAGAGVGAKVVHSLEAPAPVHHRIHRLSTPARTSVSVQPPAAASGQSAARTSATAHAGATTHATHMHHSPRPPSHDLGYLALGESAHATTAPPKPAVAVAATAGTSESHEQAPPPRSGGGSSLNYLGQ